MNKYMYSAFVAAAMLLSSCIQDEPKNNPITYGDGYMDVQLNTGKAMYKPGETVSFTLNKMIAGNVKVRYKHLNEVIAEEPLSSTSWTWTPPTTDFQGYMVDLYSEQSGKETIYGSIAVDVSSDAARFPRNGFLSAYGKMTQTEMSKVMNDLNRHHINYVQFQDWHYKHHKPLAGSVSAPLDVWTDIINRDCYKTTVGGYIDLAHQHGMKTLFYNLAYGALDDAADDGVSEEWYVFKDKNHQNKDMHALGSPFKSSIYLVNPANPGWLDYISRQTSEVYQVFDFDGYQIDQLGWRGTDYDYNGNAVDLAQTFPTFINRMKKDEPDKSLVMNAVGQYGQEGIAKTPVDFLYTEVWDHNDDNGFTILSNIITDNDKWSNGKKTILAAYMNYELGRQGRGYFNTPGILMASAAIHVWGGAHLQLGEHMLCNEYFPNSNLTMKGELKIAMVKYYDFITAYENLLRDGGDFMGVNAECTDGKVNINVWPPVRNQVATVGKHVGNRDVVHFLNYTNATHLDWCDTYGNQQAPTEFSDVAVKIPVSGTVQNVWVASPDFNSGVAQSLEFTAEGNTVQVVLPKLHYWDMVVIEY